MKRKMSLSKILLILIIISNYNIEYVFSQQKQSRELKFEKLKKEFANPSKSFRPAPLNDAKAGIIAYKPYEFDLSPFLKKGKNKVEVRVTGSLKNLF
ncbi:MAG: hypothetical protein LBK97_07435, partial [Prevotellaceae bacterium]|nr:hypothetical protein [Prevotellaceae bacterium]